LQNSLEKLAKDLGTLINPCTTCYVVSTRKFRGNLGSFQTVGGYVVCILKQFLGAVDTHFWKSKENQRAFVIYVRNLQKT
jgi:hypothetical protein